MKKKGAKKTGGKKGRRGGASTSSAGNNDDTTVADSQDTQPTQPSQPTQDTQPSQPTQDTQPSQPTQPTQPTQPSQPTQQTTERVVVKIEEGTENQEEEAKPTQQADAKGASSSSAPVPLDEDEEEDPDVKPLVRRSKRNRSATKEPEDNSPTPRAKRVKAKVETVEYVKEKRSLEDLWRAAFPVGTEFGQLDELYNSEWNFTNLEEALEEGGKLYNKRVYVFGCTESHTVLDKKETKTVLVPSVICVQSPIPPSDRIATTLNDVEELVPLKTMKLAWEPFIPLEKRDKQVDRVKFQVYVLGCTQRRSAVIHLKEDRVKKFKSCLPYIDNPYKEDESEKSTVAQITFPSEPPVTFQYDWATDNLEAFTDELMIKEEAVLADQRDELKEFVKAEGEKAKAAYEEAEQAREIDREAKINNLSEETKAAYQEMRLYKFYPLASTDAPYLSAIEKSSLINKYFGKADEVL